MATSQGVSSTSNEAATASLFLRVLDEVPRLLEHCSQPVLERIPALCWSALLSTLRYGRGHKHRPPPPLNVIYEHNLAPVPAPVLSVFPHGTLVRGLAARVSADTDYIGRLRFAGAQFPVTAAGALCNAATKARVASADMPSALDREAALMRMIDASFGSVSAPLRVVALDAGDLALATTCDVMMPHLFQRGLGERVALLRGLLRAPAVISSLEDLDLGQLMVVSETVRRIFDNLAGGARKLRHLCVEGLDMRGAAAEALAGLVRGSATLRKLDCSACVWDRGGAASVARAVVDGGTVEVLDMSATPHGDAIAGELARRGGGAVRQLKLSTTGLTPAGAADLTSGLSSTAVTSLFLGGNKLASAGARHMAALVRSSDSLATLILSDNAIGPHGAAELFDAVADSKSLEMLILEHSEIGDGGAAAAGRMLARNGKLAMLDVTHNGIGDVGAQQLAQGLAKNHALGCLSLKDETIGSDGVAAVARAALQGGSLAVVELMAGGVTDAAAGCLRDMLAGIRLQGLVFQADLTPRGWKMFAEGVARSKALHFLYLSPDSDTGRTCNLGSDGAAALGWALRGHHSLVSLDLSSCGIGPNGVGAMGQSLWSNRGLERLLLAGNDIGTFGAVYLAYAVAQIRSLHTLDISNSRVGPQGLNHVSRMLRECPKDFSLIVSRNHKFLAVELRGATPRLRILVSDVMEADLPGDDEDESSEEEERGGWWPLA
ncbi:unnamed protein product [Pedinophyceae sp. YPF-701]|nr:unnamed protein product [Pedinophyceae sp. YPF-701]